MKANHGLAVGLSLVVLVSSTTAAMLLRPPREEYANFLTVIAVPAIVAGLCAPVLRRWVYSRASIRSVTLAVGLCSLAVGALSSSGASRAMFVSGHDYRMFIVVLVLVSGIALVVGGHLSGPVARDIERLGAVAGAVADGDLFQ